MKYHMFVASEFQGSGEFKGTLEVENLSVAARLLVPNPVGTESPMHVAPGVIVLDPMNDVGSLILVSEESEFFHIEEDIPELVSSWWELTF